MLLAEPKRHSCLHDVHYTNERLSYMSDYSQKRVDYINNWPNAEPFEAETIFKEKCESFKQSNNGKVPFQPMKMWEDEGADYQKLLSRLIDSLEMMPLWPNRGFAFLFIGFDDFSKTIIQEKNITKRLKILASELYNISELNISVKDLFRTLFEAIPMRVTEYIYKRESTENNVFNRTSTDINEKITNTGTILRALNTKYNKYNSDLSENRKAGALIRYLFNHDKVEILGVEYTISHLERLQILISGFLYTLRNDSVHGASISATKSSKTTLERYALNYYSFISLYTVLMVTVIAKNKANDRTEMYSKLFENVKTNVSNMKELFGPHLGR